MATTVYVPYVIVLDDADQVAALNAAPSRFNRPRNDIDGELKVLSILGFQLGGTGKLYCSPQRAANEYGATVHMLGPDNPIESLPYVWSAYIYEADQPSTQFPIDQDVWTKTVTLFQQTTYIWVGTFVYQAPLEIPPGGVEPDDPYQRVRFFNGFEFNDAGNDGGFTAEAERSCSEASRHPGGLGYYINEDTTTSLVTINTNVNLAASFKPTASWERLYIRLRSLPTSGIFYFWALHNSVGGDEQLVFGITPTGQIAMYNRTGSSTFNLIGTTGVQVYGAAAPWLKLDVVAKCAAGAYAKLSVNGVEALNVVSFPNDGWGQEVDGFGTAGYHTASTVGHIDGTVTAGVCLHLDDWSNHDVPTNFDQKDWLEGTRVVRLRPNAFHASHSTAVWGTDPVSHLASHPWLSGAVADYFAASNATQAPLAVEFDIDEQTNGLPRSPAGGILGAIVHFVGKMAGGGTVGALQYSINGAAFVNKAISELTAFSTLFSSYLPTGLTAPEVVTTLALKYIPGASAHLRTVAEVGAAVIVCGRYGIEDVPVADLESGAAHNTPQPVNKHNHHYPRSPWVDYDFFPPEAPMVVISGTYVGNGTETLLTFRYPVTFFRSRPVVATTQDGAFFFSSMVAACEGVQAEMSSEGAHAFRYDLADPVPDIDSGDPIGECTVSIVGNNAQSNQNGLTYQYFAICDPGHRFLWADSIRHNHGTTTRQTDLYDGPRHATDWTPDYGFFHKPSQAVATTVGMWVKGLDSAVAASRADSSQTTTALEFGDGYVKNYSAFNAAADAGQPAWPFVLFRREDWSDEDHEKVLQIFSYVGDGGSARTIMLSPTGFRPLWCWIQPSNGAGFFRDASHTGTTSSVVASGGALTPNTATGITGGGVDQITVGSALNSNGVTYRVLVFMGDETGCNGGWGCPGEYEHLPPIPPGCFDEDGEEVDCPCDDSEGGEDCGDCEDCECVDDECSCVGEDCEEPECDPDVEDCDEDCVGDDCIEPCEGDGCLEFGDQCVDESQKLCNQALSLIGVGDLITDIANDMGLAAQQCRLHFDDAVKEFLERFPWDFATKYAELAWVAGESDSIDNYVNKDWIFSFRLPTDCIKPRRIVRPEKMREHDDDPPMFRQGKNDTTGKLLYTNYEDPDFEPTDEVPAAVTLEYTYKPVCVASHADALGRNALAWMMASKLAPTLSRNKLTVKDCLAMFEDCVTRASVENAKKQQQTTERGDASWITERE